MKNRVPKRIEFMKLSIFEFNCSFSSLFYFSTLLFLNSCTVELKAKESANPQNIRLVKVAHPRRMTVTNRVPFVGFVEPRRLASVHFLIPGRVARCSVKEGARLKEGQEICRLDTTAVNLEVARAQNAANAAHRVLETNLPEKQKALFEAGIIGQAEFEQVRVQSETAKAQYSDASSLHEMALKKQKEHFLKAPWEGTLTRVLAKAGQPISPEMPAAIFSDENGFQIKSDLHAAFFTRIKSGLNAKLTMVSSQRLQNPVTLLISSKAAAITPESQTFPVTLHPTEKFGQELFTSGIMASGEIELNRIENAIAIPETALNSWQQNGLATIYTVDSEGRLKLVELKTGILDNGMVEVTNGLQDSENFAIDIAPDFVNGLIVEKIDSEY